MFSEKYFGQQKIIGKGTITFLHAKIQLWKNKFGNFSAAIDFFSASLSLVIVFFFSWEERVYSSGFIQDYNFDNQMLKNCNIFKLENISSIRKQKWKMIELTSLPFPFLDINRFVSIFVQFRNSTEKRTAVTYSFANSDHCLYKN